MKRERAKVPRIIIFSVVVDKSTVIRFVIYIVSNTLARFSTEKYLALFLNRKI